jgi:hypothetical protein
MDATPYYTSLYAGQIQTSSLDDKYYNEWQCNALEMTDGIYEDGCDFFNECDSSHIHEEPVDSFPCNEPYTLGSPSFTHYTKVDFKNYIYATNNTSIGLFLTCPDSNSPDVHLSLDLTNTNKYVDSTLNYSVGDFMRILIGINGIHLKYITQMSGVHYIWNNINTESTHPPGGDNYHLEKATGDKYNALEKLLMGAFEIWGRPEYIQNAVNMLNSHITNTILTLNYTQTQSNNMYKV